MSRLNTIIVGVISLPCAEAQEITVLAGTPVVLHACLY